ncbi:MAG: S1 RNA-binding domain-containing protein [Deltaproteobacteria bacterium]|nr:S1 RNA-binding domain-containing protein [Deltaproteobacteria bacterium]
MSDNSTDNTNGNEESFADLFESYSAGMNEDIQVGDKVSGKIISIGRDTVFVDTGTKIDGIVDKAELLDDDRNLPCKEGDILELYVVSLKENEIRLSRAFSGIGGLNLLREAFEKGVPVEGKVKEECKGGFRVEVMQRRTFCPISQMDLKFIENAADYVGETYEFLITEFEENGRNIVISRRALLSRKLEKARKKFYEGLTIGTVLEGKITRLMPYGVFVELVPGVEGMVHVSELSWSRVQDPQEVVRVEDSIKVKVLGVERDDKRSDQMKISLSVKQVTGDPWDNVEEKFHAGDKIRGKVTRCVTFGAFVEIAPGIDGLVHISEMSYGKRVLRPEEVVKDGETVSVMVKEINAAKRRISLSIKDAEGDSWIDVHEKYKAEQSTEGTLEKKAPEKPVSSLGEKLQEALKSKKD